jgi:hypothetical protein
MTMDERAAVALVHERPANDKRAKFERIATARTKRIIKHIRILAGMGGPGRYKYEFAQTDVEKIVRTLEDELQQLKQIMIAPGRQLDIEFDLK